MWGARPGWFRRDTPALTARVVHAVKPVFREIPTIANLATGLVRRFGMFGRALTADGIAAFRKSFGARI
jgi:hypothetical protein